MNVDNVSRDDWIVGGLGIVLIITLLAFPWFSVGGGSVAGVSIPSFDFTATDAPDGWLGVLAVLTAIIVVADLAIERLSPQTQLPAVNDSRTMTRFVFASATAFFMLLKFLFHINHFSDLGWGFWLALIVVAALLYFTMLARTEGGPVRTSTRPATPAGTPPPASGPPAGAPPSSSPPPGPSGGSSEPPPSSPPPGS